MIVLGHHMVKIFSIINVFLFFLFFREEEKRLVNLIGGINLKLNA